MNKCLRCKANYRHNGEFCSLKCEQLKKAHLDRVKSKRKQSTESKMWKKYWSVRLRGNILPEEKSFYNKYTYLLTTERFNKKTICQKKTVPDMTQVSKM